MSELKDTQITQVALGKAHAVALTSKGHIYTFGINNKGQCGREFTPLVKDCKSEHSIIYSLSNNFWHGYVSKTEFCQIQGMPASRRYFYLLPLPSILNTHAVLPFPYSARSSTSCYPAPFSVRTSMPLRFSLTALGLSPEFLWSRKIGPLWFPFWCCREIKVLIRRCDKTSKNPWLLFYS